MSSGKLCFKTIDQIAKVESISIREEYSSLNEIESSYRAKMANATLTFQDKKMVNYSLTDFKEVPKSKLDLISIWKNSIFEQSSPNQKCEDIETVEVISVHPIPEEKILLVVTEGFLHIVSLIYKRRVIQKISFNDITACAAVCISPSCIFQIINSLIL